MNAPWVANKTNGTVTRELFAAFLQDDEALAAFKAAAQDIGWPADRLNRGGVRNAVQTLAVSNSPQVLAVDLSDSLDPRADINALAEVCEPGTLVIAVGMINDVALYRDLVASGIQDYLVKPLDAQMLRDTLYAAQQTLQGPKAAVVEEDVEHYSCAVIGTRGGVGASTVATSLAWLLAHEAGRKTALLDLDLQFGTGALAFDLEPGRGMMDAVENPNRIDSLFIERAIVKESANLAILSAEAPVNAPLHVEGAALQHLESELKKLFQFVVIDMPRQVAVQHPHLLHEVNQIVIVSEMTLAGARDAIRLLAFIKSNCPAAKLTFLVNKVGATAGLEVSQRDFEASVERTVDLIIPLDAKSALASAKEGKCFVEAARTGKSFTSYTELMQRVSTVQVEARAGGLQAMLAKFATLKSKVAKKA
jgi:pilus assembly protein CpaE